MAYGLDSEDVRALLIVLAGGDLDANLGTVIDRIEALQHLHEDHVGTTPNDLQMALFCLAAESRLLSCCDDPEPLRLLRRMTIRDIAPPLLDRPGAWCNDEGEAWDPRPATAAPADPRRGALDDLVGSVTAGSAGVLARLEEHGWLQDLPAWCMGSGDIGRS